MADPFISRNGPILASNHGSKLTQSGENLALKTRPEMLLKMGHFSSLLSFKMMSRQKCQFFHDFPKIFEEIMANPFISRNGPIWHLPTAQNCANRGGNLSLKRRHGMLQKMGHFSSRLTFEMMYRRNGNFPTISQKMLTKSWPIHSSPEMAQFGS